ncbi:hypothetical protein DPM33_15190 [Mesorhizobium hawassense]|uniref:DUF6894 domain-containing protein n=1 Tax=Mesorhizobium hawassense TaxID=1209954 RepID=A0A330HN72_9HYPH|nr:hypothetical protein [Mesorhizobium hawassense]RAZ90171.1 hypothetical protein DPM33_15190 [Mesorhizobium hawassense]
MPRFFFDLAYGGDTYQDAQGTSLHDLKLARQRAVALAYRTAAEAKSHDIVCTVRDVTGRQVLQITKNA